MFNVCFCCFCCFSQAEADEAQADALRTLLNEQTGNENLDESSSAVQRARKVLQAIQGHADQLAALAKQLAQATDVARENRQLSPLQSTLTSALGGGLPEDHDTVAAAKKLISELEAELEAQKAAEQVLQAVIDEVTTSRDAPVLEKAVVEALKVLPEDNSVVAAARKLQADIAAERDAVAAAHNTLRKAIVSCITDHKVDDLRTALDVATKAGVPVDAEEATWVKTLTDELIPKFSTQVANVKPVLEAWEGSEHDNFAANVQWLQESLTVLSGALALLAEQFERGGKQGPTPENLSGDNLCVLPTAGEKELFDKAAATQNALKDALTKLETDYETAINALTEELTTATKTAETESTSNALRETVRKCENRVPDTPPQNLAHFEKQPTIETAIANLEEGLTKARAALDDILKAAVAALNTACDNVSVA